ncbi:MAG: transglutaminase family protein [Phycisphaera sp.]|nr:transglutaminase family protein [Phycisphaera sp.]
MKYRIRHTTEYQYTEAVSTCQNLVHLTPRDLPSQRCHRFSLTVQPGPATVQAYNDYFGNGVSVFAIYQPHDKLTITADSEVEVFDADAPTLPVTQPWELVRNAVWAETTEDTKPEAIEAEQYLFDSEFVTTGPEFAEYARFSFTPNRPIGDAAMHLTRRIHREFKYAPKTTTLATSVKEVMKEKRGVCQDFAHLQIACLRSLGLPARYVSGYLRTDPPPGKPRMVGADASHAWVSVHCNEAGWIDFDPTNGCIRSSRHVVLAWGRDYADVSPIRGAILGGGEHELLVSVDVSPAEATPPAPGSNPR